MNPNRHLGLVSCGLLVAAALAGPAFGQNTPSDRELINQIPEPRHEQPVGLDGKEEKTTPPAAQTPAPPPAAEQKPQQPAAAPVVSEEIKKLTGRKLVEAPVASLTGADLAIAEKIREILAQRGERYFSRKNELSAVEVFYRDRGFKPLWIENGKLNPRADAAIAFLKKVDEDGLNPADYAAPNFDLTDADKLAEAELNYTGEVLDFVRHASSGRIHPSRTFRDVEYKHDGLDPQDSLNQIASAANLSETLAGFYPSHEQYKLLKAELAKLRNKGEAEPIRIPNGAVLRFNAKAKKHQEDARVPLLRQRFKLEAKDDKVYDEELAQAVAEFQKSRKRKGDGVLTNDVVAALNPANTDKIEDIIIANMERWRWLPRDLGANHVITSIPGYYLRVFQDRKEVWETRVVVGAPTKISPITTQEMSFITVNPTWNVPPSIIARDYIPALRNNPDALKQMGIKIQTRPDGTLHLSQPPGDGNALGRLRFNFPNKFLVYQHDTPTKHLFAHDERAYSAGCIRVQDPLKYAELLMNMARPGEGWSQDKIKKLYGTAEHKLDFKNNIPVHIVYNTAEVRDDKLIIRKDLYKVDAATIKNLKATGNERRQLEIAVKHADPTPNRQQLTLDGYSPRSQGFDFFGLFRSY
ncbi:MAG: L,D-transpeptidase family protein [Xanthobacteraceae bacterium]|nr:L,D-transpeptidase family protein [Xanthobacteraceae bacterium]QYK44606.1 MAG: L,D-transpeptidase family protein [Xanthobacteraceae bacterium]